MRIVVKLGSSLLNGGSFINTIFLDRLANYILNMGEHQFAIVTSGAISTGMHKMGLQEKPKDVAMLQALAAVGQGSLMNAYEQVFDNRKRLAQVLLTNQDFSDRMQYLNIRNTLNTLLRCNVIPIINENDTVTVRDIKKSAFGDNDALAAHVAVAIDADYLLLLTNVDGLYDKNPAEPGATLLRKVGRITDAELGMCHGAGTLGRGGMLAKLRAAKIATEASIPVVVANGSEPHVLERAVRNEIGTLFSPMEKPRLSERKHWMIFASAPKGQIVIHERALKCAIDQNCSIRPLDVLRVSGNFGKGDVIEIAGADGAVLCRGVTNYFSNEIERIKGLSVEDVYQELGFAYSEVVNHNDMVVASE